MKQFLFVTLIAFSAQLFAQDKIPVGTILPLRLNSSLHSDTARAAKQISARVMQDVPLPGGRKIHAGAKVIGHIVSAKPAANGMSDLSFRFDALTMGKQRLSMTTDLRALASLMDVEDAQVPPTGPDRGTPWNWRTRNLIGGEVAYGDGGPVERGTDIVGEALADGVLIPVKSNAAAGCRGEVAGNAKAQALWVFASDACGLYDLPHLTLAHAGRTDPVGQIELLSDKSDVKVPAGSGMLLRVNSIAP